MSTAYESGVQPYRLEFIRETTEGETPSDPDYEAYSDAVRSFEPTIDPQTEGQEVVGNPNYNDHFTGTRADSLTLSYDLQRWFVDSGNANDAAYDALVRDSNNRVPNTHSVVRRMEQFDVTNTVDSGATTKDTRQYIVGLGGTPNATITGDSTDPQPVLIELEYTFERVDTYKIDQPDADTTIDVENTGTDSVDVTIEDEGATTSETVTVAGGATQTTVDTYGDLDAVYLDAPADSDVIVSESSGEDLMVIKGSDAFDDGEGQLGVPALGSGSHAGEVGTSYELFHDDQIQYDSSTLAEEVNTNEISVENGIDSLERVGTSRPANASSLQEPTADGTIFGEAEYFDKTIDMVTAQKGDLDWTFDSGTLRLDNAIVTETGGTEESSQAIKEVDVTFGCEGVTIDP